MGTKKRGWTQAHEIERLTQLRADVDSALGRMITEINRYAVNAPTEEQVESDRKSELLESVRKLALGDIDQWLTKRCGESTR